MGGAGNSPKTEEKKKNVTYTTGKFLSGTENMKFWILVFFSFFSLGGFLVVSSGFHCR